MTAYTLNTERLMCPMPVIKVQTQFSQMTVGDTLTVTCTDPGTLHDIPAWCRIHQQEMMRVIESENLFTFELKKVSV